MNTSFLNFPIFGLCIFFTACNQKNIHPDIKERYIRADDTTFSEVLKNRGKVNFIFKGSDGTPYYFSMSDTVPTFPYNIPHVMFSQGDPINLHSILVLNNLTKIGNDSLNATLAVVDGKGYTNNAFKATPNKIGIQTTLQGDNSGGAYYQFTKNGIVFQYGHDKLFEQTYVLSNHKGAAGQVLTLNNGGDTAAWANPVTQGQKYFAPSNGQSIAIAKYAYNIINPKSSLGSLSIKLPDSPHDNDWFEVTFTQPVKTVGYTGGKVAGNAIKSAAVGNFYKKFVFRKEDSTWY